MRKVLILLTFVYLSPAQSVEANRSPLRIPFTPTCRTAVSPIQAPYSPATRVVEYVPDYLKNIGLLDYRTHLIRDNFLGQFSNFHINGAISEFQIKLSEHDDALLKYMVPEIGPGIDGRLVQSAEYYLRQKGLIPTQEEALTFLTDSSNADFIDSFTTSSLNDYVANPAEVINFAHSQYSRRKWWSKEFEAVSLKNFKDYLSRSSFIFIANRKLGQSGKRVPVAGIRFVHIHYGIVKVTNLKTGHTVEILGNAEVTYKVNKFNWPRYNVTMEETLPRLKEGFEIDSAIEYLKDANFGSQKINTHLQPETSYMLPLERVTGQPLRRKPKFKEIATIVSGDDNFKIEFGHGVQVEPGLFSIAKDQVDFKRKSLLFRELLSWFAHYVQAPPVAQSFNPLDVEYVLENDLPLYKPFGFTIDHRQKSSESHGVNWDIYSATPNLILPALKRLLENRLSTGERDKRHSIVQSVLTYIEQQPYGSPP